MKQIEALEVVQFGRGAVLQLDKEQAAARAYALSPKGNDIYETTDMVQFKRGEKFGYDGEPSKAMRALIAIEGKPAAPVAAVAPKDPGPTKFVMPKPDDIPIMRAPAKPQATQQHQSFSKPSGHKK